MQLIDEAIIYVRAGRGGDGRVSMRREKYIPKGGPDGGDGGKGGDVVLVADPHLDTLLPLSRRPHRRGENGAPGQGKSMAGADGRDCLVPVPLGTLVFDAHTGALLADISQPGANIVVARGGIGGFGNEHFKTATNQAPAEATPGCDGEERTLRLELKLIADIGLVGRPNAGKSTMLRAISRARPKVADYPFTTLQPHLGIADLPGDTGAAERRLIFADIPGLIEGASAGAGLGTGFLRHIERTRLLVHLIDVAPVDGSDPVASYREVRIELERHSTELAEKPELIVLSKADLATPEERDVLLKRFAADLCLPHGDTPILVSGATGEGVRAMLEACWSMLHDSARAASPGWGHGAAPQR
jgi:GTP-binding protein